LNSAKQNQQIEGWLDLFFNLWAAVLHLFEQYKTEEDLEINSWLQFLHRDTIKNYD
jgi:hypothetical protein